MMITNTSFCDELLWKLLILLVRNTSMEVPDDDLKYVILLIICAKGKIWHRSGNDRIFMC